MLTGKISFVQPWIAWEGKRSPRRFGAQPNNLSLSFKPPWIGVGIRGKLGDRLTQNVP